MNNKTYGHFDDAHREYVITDPQTPWPWINYLGNEDFFSLISNTAGGYSFFKDAKFRRITRYRYNGVPMDNGGRYFYIVEERGESKEERIVWNPGWKPCKTPLDSYECRHGMSYTRITGQKNGVEASVLFFVPLKKWCEVQKLTLKNLTGETKRLKLFSFAEWCLWNAATDMENFQRNFSTGEVEIDGSVIYHKTEYKERRNHYAYYSVNVPVQGFDTDRESFIGLYNEFANPNAVMEGRPRNSVAHGWSPIASHYIEVELQPGEQKDFIFVLGYVEQPQEEKYAGKTPGLITSLGDLDRTFINKVRAQQTIAEFDTVEKVNKAFAELAEFWDDLLDRYTVKTGNESLDRMVNIWNQYQCMVTFNFSRSASFFESGVGRGMGFRDSNQDLVGFVHQIPSRARERIIDIAHHRHRLHPVPRRRLLPPVPATHQARQQRHRRRIQRRPHVAHLRYRCLHQGNGRLLHPRRDGALGQRARHRGIALRPPAHLVQPRLSQPELLLMGPQREFPDHREQQRRLQGRVAHDCRPLRGLRQGLCGAL